MARCLGSPANYTKFTVVLDEASDARPYILASNKVECLVEAVVPEEQIVVLIPEHSKSKVKVVGNIDAVVEKE